MDEVTKISQSHYKPLIKEQEEEMKLPNFKRKAGDSKKDDKSKDAKKDKGQK